MVRLKAPFTYVLRRKDGPVSVTVPKGFRTDLASIPRLIDDWFGLNPSGRLAKAAVLHDWLYEDEGACAQLAADIAQEADALGHGYAHDMLGVERARYLAADHRRLADRVFLEALGVPPLSGWAGRLQTVIQHLAFWSVRLFGGRAWAATHEVDHV